MSCDYHDRVDFRAFDVMVKAISKATPPELRSARLTAREMRQNLAVSAYERRLWGAFEAMLEDLIRNSGYYIGTPVA